MTNNNFPCFDSISFDRVIYSTELENFTIEDLYLLKDEFTVVLNDLLTLFKNLPKEEKATSSLKDEIRNLKIFQVTMNRIIYKKNKSEVEGLRKCLTAWKQRAILLGSELGFSKSDLKQLVEVQNVE